MTNTFKNLSGTTTPLDEFIARYWTLYENGKYLKRVTCETSGSGV